MPDFKWLLRSRNFSFSSKSLNALLTRNYSVRVRFAPSPTGHLHLGGLRTALYNFLFCKKHNGKYILRVEDTDQTRLVNGATEHLIDMLKWTGIEFDEGPHIGGSYGPYIQSQRLDLYSKHCEQLIQKGHAYKCFCTPERLELLRKQAASRGEVPKYDNRCRHLSQEEVQKKINNNMSYVVRLKLSSDPYPWHDLVYGEMQQALNEGDAIIMKSDGFPTYHLANVVDDHLMEITHVMRGVEWQVSTVKHLMMYEAFGWKPPQFAHLPLLQNKDGKKLSKRQNDVQVEHYKSLGFFPEAVLNLVTNMGSGFDERDTSGMNISQLVKLFNLTKLHTNSTRVDFDRIYDFNRLHLKMKLEHDANHSTSLQLNDYLRKLVEEHYKNKLEDQQCLEELSDDYINGILKGTTDRISLMSDLLKPEYTFLWIKNRKQVREEEILVAESSLSSTAVVQKSSSSSSSSQPLVTELEKKLIAEVIVELESSNETCDSAELLADLLKKTLVKNKETKYGQLMRLLRRSLGGPKEGPSVAEMMVMLGKKHTVIRLKKFIED